MYFLRITKEMNPKDCILFQFCIPCSKEVGVIALGPWESELNTLNTMCKESDINIWCYIQTQIKSLSYHLYSASHLLFEKKNLVPYMMKLQWNPLYWRNLLNWFISSGKESRFHNDYNKCKMFQRNFIECSFLMIVPYTT